MYPSAGGWQGWWWGRKGRYGRQDDGYDGQHDVNDEQHGQYSTATGSCQFRSCASRFRFFYGEGFVYIDYVRPSVEDCYNHGDSLTQSNSL